jgi:uncharacterized delta-60 repeat protein
MEKNRQHHTWPVVLAILSFTACVPSSSSNNSIGPRQPTNEIRAKLDRSFGESGRKAFSIAGNEHKAHSMVIRSDGKIVLLAETRDARRNSLAQVIQLNKDGSFDDEFAKRGVSVFNFQKDQSSTVYSDQPESVALQPDGQIVICGHTDDYLKDSNSQPVIARLTRDGILDKTLGQDGKSILKLVGRDGSALVNMLQPDGKIVIAGYVGSTDQSNPGILVGRFLVDGRPDPTFGGKGYVITQLENSSEAYSLDIQADGKVVVGAGATGDGGRGELAVLRYLVDGSLDNSFGTSGIARVATGGRGSAANDLVVLPDGRVLALGWSLEGPLGLPTPYIARLTNSGESDLTYGIKGIVKPDFGRDGVLERFAVRQDGVIAAGGVFGADLAIMLLDKFGDPQKTNDKLDVHVLRNDDIGGPEALVWQSNDRLIMFNDQVSGQLLVERLVF